MAVDPLGTDGRMRHGLHGIKLEMGGNRVTAGNAAALEANPLKIMAGAPYLLTYN